MLLSVERPSILNIYIFSLSWIGKDMAMIAQWESPANMAMALKDSGQEQKGQDGQSSLKGPLK